MAQVEDGAEGEHISEAQPASCCALSQVSAITLLIPGKSTFFICTKRQTAFFFTFAKDNQNEMPMAKIVTSHQPATGGSDCASASLQGPLCLSDYSSFLTLGPPCSLQALV